MAAKYMLDERHSDRQKTLKIMKERCSLIAGRGRGVELIACAQSQAVHNEALQVPTSVQSGDVCSLMPNPAIRLKSTRFAGDG